MFDSSNPPHDPLAALIDDLPLDRLSFAPVPVRARRDGWTAERQAGFIYRLALCGCVTTAAAGVGMLPRSAYRLREREGAESFARAWDRAIGWGRDNVADLTIQRAIEGEIVPVFSRGRKVGERVRHDNRLLISALRFSWRPKIKLKKAKIREVLDELFAEMALEVEGGSTENKGLFRDE